jgi:DNA helicase-2/ATP-dependent DNA helicase PcrA
MLIQKTNIDTIKEKIEKKHKNDKPQLNVIFSESNRLLVEAPAGYGKTHTMVSKIAYMIATNKIPTPKKLLALTFSVNAAYKIKKDTINNIPELLDSIDEKVNIKSKIFVSNYHGFCRSVLKKYGQKLHAQLSKLDTLQSIDDSDTRRLMQSVNGLSLENAEFFTNYNNSVKNIDGKFLKENFDRYNNLVISELLPQNAIPYNAILTLTLKLFRDFPNILQFYNKYFPAILVDEFQDTNLLSYWLLQYLITKDTKLILLGDSLQRIYGFIGAVPNLLDKAESKFEMDKIQLSKNYRFASNHNMLQLDKIIRQNALTPFENPDNFQANVNFEIYQNQSDESLEVVKKSIDLIENSAHLKVAIIVKQRGENINHIIKTFNHNSIPFFYGLFTDEDASYIQFNRKCLFEFIELLKSNKRITKKLAKSHIEKINNIYKDDNSAIIKALFKLLSVFWERMFIDYSLLSFEDKINLIKDTFEHNGLKQFMEYLDSNIVISTVHAAKGLEWDYVIIPDMEQDLFPNWFGLCGKCRYRRDCNIQISNDNEKDFLEELSVFYVAVTRARKQVFFFASNTQITRYGEKAKNISCFMKLPGMVKN